MGGWGYGPGMVQEPELEEGETGYYKDDEANIDPDIALSYIGDKVQSILGHLQKDFEGGVSAENLGAKFGGYGSFLPVYKRSPSIRSQPKSPQKVQDLTIPGSPKHLFPEGPASTSAMVPDAPSTRRVDTASPFSTRPSETLKNCSGNASVGQGTSLSSKQVAETIPEKVELSSSKLDNQTNQRTLKVRIKVGADRIAQYNAEIDSLGLASPSSSPEISLGESGELSLESHETPYESPTYILQIMTCSPVPGGLLLSPLSEDLLNLVKETKSSVDSEYQGVPKSSVISDKLLNIGALEHVKTSIDSGENIKNSKSVCTVDSRECKDTNPGSHTLGGRTQPLSELNCKRLSDTVRKHEKAVQVKKRKGSKDKLKGRAVSVDLVKAERTSDQSFDNHEEQGSRCKSVEKVSKHQTRTSNQEVLFDHGQGVSSDKSHNASLKANSDISEARKVKGALDNSVVKFTRQPASGEQDGLEMARDLSKLSAEKRFKESQSRGNSGSKLATDKLQDGSAAPKNKHSGKKDVHRVQLSQKDAVDTSVVHKENRKLVIERPSSCQPKSSDFEGIKAKPVYADNLKERSSNKIFYDNLTMPEAPAAAILSTEGIISGSQQIAPVDDWVGCDHCQKWRLLPYGRKSEDLPEVWFCSMLDWLPGMNRCDISEDETNKAFQALPQLPFPGNQSTFQAHADRTVFGVSSAGDRHLAKDHLNFASARVADKVKKPKLKEKLTSFHSSDPVTSNNGKKKLQQHTVKRGNSVELNQPGENATKESSSLHVNKLATVLPKLKKRKDEHVITDDAAPRKKIRKESFQRVDGMMAKIKHRGAISGGNLDTSGHILASGSPSKASWKDLKKENPQQDSSSGGTGKLQISLKKQMKTCNEIEVSKKRKLKSDEDSLHQVEKQHNSMSNLQVGNSSMGTEIENGDLHRHKKYRVSHTEENELKTYKDNVIKRNSAEARVGILGNNEYPMYKDRKHQVRKSRVEPQLTFDDIVKLRRDLGCEELATAATSSSSKVSDSRKNRISYTEVRGSPGKSVSSSPARNPCPTRVSPLMPNVGKINSRFSDIPAVGSVKKVLDVNEGAEMGIARKGKTTGVSCPGSSGNPTLDFQETDAKKNSRGDANHGCSKEGIDKDRNDTMLRQPNSRENSSQRSMDKNRRFTCERTAEKPCTSMEALYSNNKLGGEGDVGYNCRAPQNEALVDTGHHFSDDSIIKPVRSNRSVGKRGSEERGESRRECDKNYAKSNAPGSADMMQKKLNQDLMGASVEPIPGQEAWSGKLRIDLRAASKPVRSLKRCSMDSRPFDTSVMGGTLALKDTSVSRHQNGVSNFTSHKKAEESLALNTSLANNNDSSVAARTTLKEAEVVLREAEGLRVHADLIKNSGFGSESTYEYFKAGLKFLQGASLSEAFNSESSKHNEMNTLQMYGTAAELCKTCALEYEKGHEMAAASLAYKCVEVAYLRVVYCKSSSHRIWHDLQSDLKMVPQGESPSSSASDVDNLNNLVIAEKATMSKGKVSHSGNHGKVAPSRSSLVRLLDFTNDVNSAMEAAKKSQDMFAAACAQLEESDNHEGIVSIKRVIDFSFQDVAEFVSLIWSAFNTINRQGLSG